MKKQRPGSGDLGLRTSVIQKPFQTKNTTPVASGICGGVLCGDSGSLARVTPVFLCVLFPFCGMDPKRKGKLRCAQKWPKHFFLSVW